MFLQNNLNKSIVWLHAVSQYVIIALNVNKMNNIMCIFVSPECSYCSPWHQTLTYWFLSMATQPIAKMYMEENESFRRN